VIVALILGILGATLGYQTRLPAGVLIGAIAGVGTANLAIGDSSAGAPPEANQLLQILVGILVGSRVSRDSLAPGARALVPAFLLSLIIISLSVASAIAAASLNSLDLLTAIFAAAPGGITEMTAIGTSFGADGASLAAVHLVRVLLTIAIVSLLWRSRSVDTESVSSLAYDSAGRPGSEDKLRGWNSLGPQSRLERSLVR
jgi:membrane AbrB-like protein